MENKYNSMQWMDEDLRRQINQRKLKMLDELKLCFREQYPIRSFKGGLFHFFIACKIVWEEIPEK